jgi:hypothetical protein
VDLDVDASRVVAQRPFAEEAAGEFNDGAGTLLFSHALIVFEDVKVQAIDARSEEGWRIYFNVRRLPPKNLLSYVKGVGNARQAGHGAPASSTLSRT